MLHGMRAMGFVLLATACTSSHVRLVAPDTTAGARYTCAPGEGLSCQPATTDVPEELNQSGTVFVVLPRECKGKIHQIVIFDAGTAKPKVDATCAPEEEPLEEMSQRSPAARREAQNSPRAALNSPRAARGQHRPVPEGDHAADVSVH
jgi:hypothetical protein